MYDPSRRDDPAPSGAMTFRSGMSNLERDMGSAAARGPYDSGSGPWNPRRVVKKELLTARRAEPEPRRVYEREEAPGARESGDSLSPGGGGGGGGVLPRIQSRAPAALDGRLEGDRQAMTRTQPRRGTSPDPP